MDVKDGASLSAIEELYKSRLDDFVRTASAIANSREGGRDAVHDAFVAAVHKRGSYHGAGTIEAWLWKIVVRSALRRRRIEARRPIASAEAIWTDPDENAWPEVRAAVEALPERQRLMLFLRYYADLDYKAIAGVTGVEIGTVGAELHTAHQSLRRRLEEVSKS